MSIQIGKISLENNVKKVFNILKEMNLLRFLRCLN